MMGNVNHARLIEGNIPQQLLKLALPMILGMMGMIIFNLADTYYVGQLGEQQLAAISFTFPVVMVVHSIAAGIALGTSVIISKVVGEGNRHKVARLTTDSLVLSLLINAILIVFGLLTIEPLFSLLGAKGKILNDVKEYMLVWYSGMIMVVIPQIGNNIIRALGDTKTPGIIMAVAACTNIILDPLLIFGIGPFPSLGIKGAAIATVISRAITLIVAIYVLIAREKLLIFEKRKIGAMIESWKKIIYIGIPNSLIQMALPVGAGVVTRILASYGSHAVAGFGVASKIEYFALVFISALAVIMGPFIGQNLGAQKLERVSEGFKTGERFSLLAGVFIAFFLGLFAKPIASVFNKDAQVVATIAMYLRIVPLSYAFQGILKIGCTILNVFNKPYHSSALIIIQTFIIYIPLSILGAKFLGIKGVFAALAISFLITGPLAHLEVKRQLQASRDGS